MSKPYAKATRAWLAKMIRKLRKDLKHKDMKPRRAMVGYLLQQHCKRLSSVEMNYAEAGKTLGYRMYVHNPKPFSTKTLGASING